ncbi:MAG: iron ABC transporter permease, partial [Gemmatimonadota bacterium]|nr:iron ABC transporter permease [Gemmatimonadota bacterium]
MTGRRTRWGAWALAIGLTWLVAYPILIVGGESVTGPAGFTLEYLRRFAAEPREWQALWGSIWTSVASVILAAAIGIPLAFLFERWDFPGRRLIGALVALPAVLPPLVGVIAFLFLYGESGFAARLVQWILRRDEPPWRLQGAWAILLVHAYSLYVYFYLLTRAALARLDPAMVEAAASLGAGRWRTLRHVTLPLLGPALRGAALLCFMTALASFSAPYLFGGGFRVMTTQIVTTRLNGDYRMAMAQTLVLSLVALVGLGLAQGGGAADRGSGKGLAPAARPIRHPWTRRAATVGAWLLGILLLLPHATLLLLSFVPAGTWTVEPLPPVYSTMNYAALATEPERLRPLGNSLWMATVATAAALGIAVAAGLLSGKGQGRLGRAIEGLLAVPWLVPGTVFAIAIATAFSVHQPWAGRVVLVGTIWILPMAYLVRNLPIASRSVLAGFRSLDPSLGEAAASLGASRRRAFWRVTLPLLRPAIAAGATLAFV